MQVHTSIVLAAIKQPSSSFSFFLKYFSLSQNHRIKKIRVDYIIAAIIIPLQSLLHISVLSLAVLEETILMSLLHSHIKENLKRALRYTFLVFQCCYRKFTRYEICSRIHKLIYSMPRQKSPSFKVILIFLCSLSKAKVTGVN